VLTGFATFHCLHLLQRILQSYSCAYYYCCCSVNIIINIIIIIITFCRIIYCFMSCVWLVSGPFCIVAVLSNLWHCSLTREKPSSLWTSVFELPDVWGVWELNLPPQLLSWPQQAVRPPVLVRFSTQFYDLQHILERIPTAKKSNPGCFSTISTSIKCFPAMSVSFVGYVWEPLAAKP